jgi:diadenosine tetraphosphate (Ap4A) HIT family hydrolase
MPQILGKKLTGEALDDSSFLPLSSRSSWPKSSATLHVLLVPKRQVAGLEEIGPDDLRFLADLFEVVRSLLDEYDLAPAGYRLISNGGRYQDVPQLHFHLISGETHSQDK